MMSHAHVDAGSQRSAEHLHSELGPDIRRIPYPTPSSFTSRRHSVALCRSRFHRAAR
ncbi:hypothetical protein ABIA39_005418 [Nocardia sp. GAS34]